VTAAPSGKPVSAKPTVEELGIDVAALEWQHTGAEPGSIEIAFAGAKPDGPAAADAAEWVLMRVVGDPDQRVLVYDRFEWECFLDGVKNGEFDNAQ
jgi:hypothetical protein